VLAPKCEGLVAVLSGDEFIVPPVSTFPKICVRSRLSSAHRTVHRALNGFLDEAYRPSLCLIDPSPNEAIGFQAEWNASLTAEINFL
jgi:hypothetical protein